MRQTLSRIAILSNVNYDYALRMLSRDFETAPSEGYGNELGALLNPDSAYHRFAPEFTFLLEDLFELIGHETQTEAAAERINAWFDTLSQHLLPQRIYYISDAFLHGDEIEIVPDLSYRTRTEECWNERLYDLAAAHPNVRVFPFRRIVEGIGTERAFSPKMWYMGRIPLGTEGMRLVCKEIAHIVTIHQTVSKKVLLLDLDNTLWGGLAGENDHTPVRLSEEGNGQIYKNAQRVIRQIKDTGAVLAVVSKNNEADALNMIKNHPHMILREEDFVSIRINWDNKASNVRAIARELNVGTDSFVFWDDSPQEREEMKALMPEVAVPDFPPAAEDIPHALAEIYHTYFEKPVITGEDAAKTRQYQANAQRKQMESQAGNYEEYLQKLEIELNRVDPLRHRARVLQLVNKTNQFNLTTCRYSEKELEEILSDNRYSVYAYEVEDKFGSSGLTAVLVVDLEGSHAPRIIEFVMSCRIMGRLIENAIVDDVENELLSRGYDTLEGVYIPTAKNKPVERLYEGLGYQRVAPEDPAVFRKSLNNKTKLKYFAHITEGDRPE